jgi:hypothetical protein
MARLSACLLSAATVIALLSMAPLAHAEKPLAPRIAATNPTSSEAAPASSVVPLVSGEAEPEGGIIISVVNPLAGGRARAAAAGQPTQHPGYEIEIYALPECQGVLVASGRADAFEEAGLTASVAENAETKLSARQVDPSDPTHPSECSPPFSYWEGNVPKKEGPSSGGGGSSDPPPSESVSPSAPAGASKPEAPRLHMGPGARANDNDPRVVGSAPGAVSVLVYANSNCAGSPVAKAAAAQLAAGLSVHVADNTTTAFSAVSVGGQRSACSAPVTYVEDSTAPLTRITMGPGVKTRKRKAVFRFADVSDDPPGSTFLCKVDRARWKPCSSPLQLRHLRRSSHVVRVRAVDVAGNVETRPAKRRFRVVSRP